MKSLVLGFFALIIYAVFMSFYFFSGSATAVSSSGEIDPVVQESEPYILDIPSGNYYEVNRPPVYIGISPGGPSNHIIKLQTGVVKREL